MRIANYILYFLCCLLLLTGFYSDSAWETKREEDNIKLQYRWINEGTQTEVREFRSVMLVHAGSTEIISSLNDENKLKLWTAKAKECKVYNKTENSWVTYTLFDIPRPFAQQDVVLKHTIHRTSSGYKIAIQSFPNFIPYKADTKRLDNYKAYWRIIPDKENKYRVEFYYTSTQKQYIPRFIMDPILQEILMDSFQKFILISESSL